MITHQKKLILIDGNAIIHRAFHALPPFKTSRGELVNSVYGFASVLLHLLNTEQPDYIAVSFDLKGPTFRHREYADYKATRVKAPQELYDQIPRIRHLVQAFQIPIYEMEGFEADDILGTLAKQADQKNLQTYIVTGDLDTLQLVSEKTKVMTLLSKFSQPIIYDLTKVLGRYGLTPSQITDMKGLQGDPSDNLKGVKGIGPKTAKELLQKYGSLENIYRHLPDLKITIRNKLKNGEESAFLSKKLATIITHVPITLDLKKCKTHEYDEEKLRQIFRELEFKSLLARLNTFHKNSLEKKNLENNLQESLF